MDHNGLLGVFEQISEVLVQWICEGDSWISIALEVDQDIVFDLKKVFQLSDRVDLLRLQQDRK
jgi:hypothetical protein